MQCLWNFAPYFLCFCSFLVKHTKCFKYNFYQNKNVFQRASQPIVVSSNFLHCLAQCCAMMHDCGNIPNLNDFCCFTFLCHFWSMYFLSLPLEKKNHLIDFAWIYKSKSKHAWLISYKYGIPFEDTKTIMITNKEYSLKIRVTFSLKLNYRKKVFHFTLNFLPWEFLLTKILDLKKTKTT